MFYFLDGRFATIQSCLKGMREAHISILERFPILFFPLLLGSWRTYIIQEVEILSHTRYFLELLSVIRKKNCYILTNSKLEE
jgi:hypothetical protein